MAFQQSLVEAITGSKQELVQARPDRLFVAIRCCVVDGKDGHLGELKSEDGERIPSPGQRLRTGLLSQPALRSGGGHLSLQHFLE